MRAGELRGSAEVVAGLMKKADLLASIRQCRDARDENTRQAASNRLGQSAKIVLQGLQSMSPAERVVVKQVHLEKLASVDYWKALISTQGDDKARQAEFVQMYSRVMFASSHLPALARLLSDVSDTPASYKTANGEGQLAIKLTDAGEKAADPDRIARAIDGIDMIYSACASLARKPAIDILLLSISGHPDKTITFVGDQDCGTAVHTVIDSIPDAVAQFDPDEEIELAELVDSLPVFDDLATLEKLGTFSKDDLQNINDTMHQGVLLALESGVILVEQASSENSTGGVQTQGVQTLNKRVDAAPASVAVRSNGAASGVVALGRDRPSDDEEPDSRALREAQLKRREQQAQRLAASNVQSAQQATQPTAQINSDVPEQPGSVDEQDEFYQQYLEERERLRKPEGVAGIGASLREVGDRGNAMANLLKGLGRSKE